jgi:hypothetical protein
MKVIAKTSNGYLFEGDRMDIALMMGYKDSYSMKGEIEIGLEMDMKKIARTSEFIRNIDQNKLSKAVELLESAISQVNETQEVAKSLLTFLLLSEDHTEEGK